MTIKDYESVKLLLKEKELPERRCLALLDRFCKWIRKSPDELIYEGKQHGMNFEKLLAARLAEYHDFLKKRKISPYFHHESEYVIRKFYQVNGLPIETTKAKRRLAQYIWRKKKEGKIRKKVAAEVNKMLAKMLDISLADAENLITVRYEPYVNETGERRLKVTYSLYDPGDPRHRHVTLDKPVEYFEEKRLEFREIRKQIKEGKH